MSSELDNMIGKVFFEVNIVKVDVLSKIAICSKKRRVKNIKMSSFCQQNSSKINGNDGIYRIKIQNIVQKENIKHNI